MIPRFLRDETADAVAALMRLCQKMAEGDPAGPLADVDPRDVLITWDGRRQALIINRRVDCQITPIEAIEADPADRERFGLLLSATASSTPTTAH